MLQNLKYKELKHEVNYHKKIKILSFWGGHHLCGKVTLASSFYYYSYLWEKENTYISCYLVILSTRSTKTATD